VTDLGPFPLALDGETTRRLAVVREVFESGVSRSSVDNRAARVLAVIDFDFAVETLLRVVHKTLAGESPDRSKTVPTLLKDVNKFMAAKLGTGLSEYAEVDRMHAIRNGVQHHAEYPTEDQTIRIRQSAAICVEATLRAVWGIGLFDVDEIDSIDTTTARTRLKQARSLLDEEEPEPNKVLGLCWLAMSEVLEVCRREFIGQPPAHGTQIVTASHFGHNAGSEDLLTIILRTQDLVLVQALGVDPVAYGRFTHLTSGFFLPLGRDEPIRSMGMDTPEPTLDTARRMYTFVVSAIIQIETRVGVLEGRDVGTAPRFH
jgi:hypothetical protein